MFLWIYLTVIISGLVVLYFANRIVDKRHPNIFKEMWHLFTRYGNRYKLWVLATLFTPLSLIMTIVLIHQDWKDR